MISIQVRHGLAWKIKVKSIEITQTQRSREHVLEHFRGKTDRNRHMPQTVIIAGYIDTYSIKERGHFALTGISSFLMIFC